MSIPTPASTTPRTASRVTRTSASSSHHPSSPSSADSPEPSTSGARRDASLACAACGEANGPERNFCAACGEPLREACPRCGAAHARSERFCGQCGLNVGDHYAEQQQYCRERLEAARQLKAECRFDDALQRLKEVLKVTDAKPGETKLAEFVREANDELRHLHAERLRREQEANQTLEIARQAIANHAIERAITLLDDVPQPLRTAAHQETLAEAKARWKEILGLSGQIRSLLAEKKTLELSGPIERLLALKPDHREARQLADQLAAKLVDAARKKMLQREFDDALALLRRIPAVARPAGADEIENEANEAVWLMKHLRRAAYVTPVLAQVAERAARTAPDHPDLARVTNELIQRQRAKPRTPWLAAPEWSV
ncbi:MAG TPA: zinc ribbon domain-containing protein, partial [Pirellulaceae bacterium]|nr:zinc ribbon domain-containing protein [Pirellulaceae bacterium]